MTQKIFSNSAAAINYANDNNLRYHAASFSTGFGEEGGYLLLNADFQIVESVIVRDFYDGNTYYEDLGYVANRYLVRCSANGDAIEGADTIEEAINIIAEYEADDKEEGNYCPDFYEVYEVVRDEVVNIAEHI